MARGTETDHQAASDPNTDGKILGRLAAQFPQLRPVIFQNPACPPKLKSHLEELGRTGNDPAMADFLRQKDSAEARAAAQNNSPSTSSVPIQPTYTPAKKKSRKRVIIIIAVLVIAWLLLKNPLGWGAPEPVRPIPDDALSEPLFALPSGNAACEFIDKTVTCSILERDYSANGLKDCDTTYFSISIYQSDTKNPRVSVACSQSYIGDSQDIPFALELHETTSKGDLACSNHAHGLVCWDQKSGKGFRISQDSYSTF